MSQSRKFVSLSLAILLLLAVASTAFAGGPPTNTTEVITGPIGEWMLPAGTCDAAPLGLTGNGEQHAVIHTRVNSDGSSVIKANVTIRGEAWDSTGAYTFVYSNNSVEQIPAGGGPHQISMVDSFVLNGSGSVGHMNVGFNWRWTYTPPADMWPPNDNWERTAERGDPLHCDPL